MAESNFICIFIQCKESVDANSELFKETYDAALDKNTRMKSDNDLISASLISQSPFPSFFSTSTAF